MENQTIACKNSYNKNNNSHAPNYGTISLVYPNILEAYMSVTNVASDWQC